jgi:hypothetical protein
MTRRRLVAVGLALLVALSTGCRGGDPVADIRLDGTPRLPDRAGVVEAVSLKDITVDGKTTPLSRRLLAFSTYTLAALPVLQTKGTYVHLGTKDGKVVWVALVAKLLGEKAFYDGTFVRAEGGGLVFQDGTVLVAAAGVAPPPPGTRVLAEIDVTHDRVAKFSG